MSATVLLTGFEPYGGRGLNPAHQAMKALDGRTIGNATVVGRGLPVSLTEVRSRLPRLIEEVKPVAVISLGLWPGEAVIRLERVGVNIVDYEIRDNDGAFIRDGGVADNAQEARFSTLPLRAIEKALLEQGTPVRISATAGTFCYWGGRSSYALTQCARPADGVCTTCARTAATVSSWATNVSAVSATTTTA